MVDVGSVNEVVIQGQALFVSAAHGRRFKVVTPQDSDLITILKQKKGGIHSGTTASWTRLVYVTPFFMASDDPSHRRMDIFHPEKAGRVFVLIRQLKSLLTMLPASMRQKRSWEKS